jgi:hypothetical protein
MDARIAIELIPNRTSIPPVNINTGHSNDKENWEIKQTDKQKESIII